MKVTSIFSKWRFLLPVVMLVFALFYPVVVRAAPDQNAPILLIYNSAYTNNYFGAYLGEILRAEGLNAFYTINLNDYAANDAGLAAELIKHKLTILAETSLTAGQATVFSNYVNNQNGRLLAMRPDSQIAGLFGLGSGTIVGHEGYITIDTGVTWNGQTPLTGLTTSNLQLHEYPVIHGTEIRYGLSGGTTLASTTTGSYPAVVGSANGRTVAFTYDLASTVALIRQGSPANALIGTPVGDVDGDGIVRTIDLFQNGWLDLNLVPIPQADEHIRLFSRLVQTLVKQAHPLPQLWYFPGTTKTMLILTGDTHGGDAAVYGNELASISSRGGTISFYLTRWSGYPANDTDLAALQSQGAVFGLHPYGAADGVSLATGYNTVATWWAGRYSQPWSRTVRHHQIAWEGWTDAADVAAAAPYNIRMDTSFYHYGTWLDRDPGAGTDFVHGYMNGSGLAMKFIRTDGTVLPIYQQQTHLVDEHLLTGAGAGIEGLSPAQAYAVSQQLINASQSGNYSALMTMFHLDYYADPTDPYGNPYPAQLWAEATMDYANTLSIPLWDADRWLSFTETRHDADFTNMVWDSTNQIINFNVAAAATPGVNLTVMVPETYNGSNFYGALVDSVNVTASTSTTTIKGQTMRMIPISAGNHALRVRYGTPTAIGLQSFTVYNPVSTSMMILILMGISASILTGIVLVRKFYLHRKS
jgi:hypothetical protein